MQPVSGIRQRAALVFAVAILFLATANAVLLAQNLGAAPQVNVAVQGQTGAQPEGAFLNLVNWIGNVIAPVGAGLALPAASSHMWRARGRAIRRNGDRLSGGFRRHATARILDRSRRWRYFIALRWHARREGGPVLGYRANPPSGHGMRDRCLL